MKNLKLYISIIAFSTIMIFNLFMINEDLKNSSFSLNNLKVAFAVDVETPPPSPVGTYPNCTSLGTPWGSNGGYWASGERSDETETRYEYFKLEYGVQVIIGFFKSAALAEASAGCSVSVTGTQATFVQYTCDGADTSCCGIANWYRL